MSASSEINGVGAETENDNAVQHSHGSAKKQILLNAFDMSTVGHLSPGQWKVSFDCINDGGVANDNHRIQMIDQLVSEI